MRAHNGNLLSITKSIIDTTLVSRLSSINLLPYLLAGFIAFIDVFPQHLTAQTTISRRIAASSDDAEEEGPDGANFGPGAMYLVSTDLEMVTDIEPLSSGTQKIGLRFTGLNIPQGATITNAYITFRAVAPDSPNNNSGTTSLTIRANDVSNATTFTSTAYNISNRALTAASVSWSPTAWTSGTDYNSPDISTVIQEVVSRSGWASGNSIALIITGTGSRSAESYNGNPATAPLLVVTYTSCSFSISGTQVNASPCFGASNGSINISVSGGTPPYTFDWSDIAGASNVQNRSGLASGTYKLAVSDAAFCTANASFTILPTQALSFTSVVTGEFPPGNNGTINVTAIGGISPYTFDWADIPGTNNIEDRTGLSQGTYSLTITDSNGCSKSGTIVVGVESTVIKQLYLTAPGQGLDRVSPSAVSAIMDTSSTIGQTITEVPRGVAIWHENGVQTPQYKIYDGTNNTFGAESLAPSVANNKPSVMMTARSPTDPNEAFLLELTDGKQLYLHQWNGTSWTAGTFNPLGGIDPAKNKALKAAQIAYSSNGNAMLVWDNDLSDNLIHYRTWNGTSWGSAQSFTITTGANNKPVNHMILAAHPRSDEMVLVFNDEADKDDYAYVWNGSSWGNGIELTIDGSLTEYDINVTYEQNSGHALVVFGKADDGLIYYRTWNGTVWGAEQSKAYPAGATLNARMGSTAMASAPNSDIILLAFSTEAKEAIFMTWDGSAFLSTTSFNKVIPTLDKAKNISPVDIAFESQSGQALGIVQSTGANTASYLIWNATTGYSSLLTTPAFADKPRIVELIPDPLTDKIMLTTNSNKIGTTLLWDGSAWGTIVTHEIDMGLNGDEGAGNGIPITFFWYPYEVIVEVPTTTFIQNTTMCSPFTIVQAGTISVSAYINVETGSLVNGQTYNINAVLRQGGITIATMNPATYSSANGGRLTWTGTLPSSYTVPAGQTLSLDITMVTYPPNVSFSVLYDNSAKPSSISLPTTSYIDVNSVKIYDNAYPNGNEVVSGVSGTTRYIRSVVSDPFGYDDIRGLDLNISPVGGTVSATSVATAGCTRTYEYAWLIPGTPANYTIQATAKEGYENTVTDTRSTGIVVCTDCPPVASDDIASGLNGEPVIIDVLANDYDPNNNINPGSLTVLTQGNNGSASVDNNAIIYVPNGSFAGIDSFTYRICDTTNPTPLCDTASVVVTISTSSYDACAEATEPHIYFVPFPEQDARTALLASASNNPTITDIQTIISLLMPYSKMIVIWDHWEDGYEVNPQSPTQSTTLIWGDNNPYNGIAPGYPDDIIPPGASIVLNNIMPANPRVSSNIFFDGRDKIVASGQIAMTQTLGSPQLIDIQSMKTNITSVTDYGRSFTIPAGENFPSQDFRYTALFIRSSADNNVVQVDKDNNGSFETTATLSQGQPLLVNGGVLSGATVISSKPIGVDVHWGGVDTYSSREAPIFPATWYADVYYCPVPTVQSPDTAAVMLYNSLNRPLNINWSSGIPSSGSVTLPAKSVVRFPLALSQTAGYKFVNPTGEAFVAIELIDSYTPGGGGNVGTTYDWSFNLISEDRLTNFSTIAWAPGSYNLSQNVNPVWVTPADNTIIYVKYDGDILSGGSVSPCGIYYDQAFTLNALTHRRLFDPSGDNDQRNMAIFTCDGTKLAMVYGADPSVSGPSGPGSWDVGTTMQPFCLDKLVLANDDIAYTLNDEPVTVQVLNNDATFLSELDPTSVSIAGLQAPAHGTVSVNTDGSILYRPDIGFSGQDTFEYQVCSTAGFPPIVVCDRAIVVVVVNACPTPQGQNIIAGQIFLDRNKNGLNDDDGSGITPGQVYLYLDNNCNGTIDANEILDTVNVDASGTYQFLVYPERIVADNFNNAAGTASTCASGSDGTASWLTNWVDAGEGGSTGFCVTPAQSEANTDAEIVLDGSFGYALRLDDNNVSATRQFDMQGATAAYLSFTYRRASSSLSTNESIQVQLSTNGSTFTDVYTIAGDGNTDAAYIPVDFINISSFNTTGTTYLRFLTNNGVDEGDHVFIDDISIYYLRYPVCYMTQVSPSALSSTDYYFSTTTRHTLTATNGGTCYYPLDFGIAKNSVTISGTLFNDNNALTDGDIDGTASGLIAGQLVYAYLVDSNGKVAFKTTVNAGNGTFSFPLADVYARYTLLLSTTSVALYTDAPSSGDLPVHWVATGDSYGRNNSAGSNIESGKPDLSIPIITTNNNIDQIRFGVQQVMAGPDQTVCQDAVISMSATSIPGLWTADQSNPGTVNIINPDATNATISDFSNAGTYRFVWSYNGVGDTVQVTVNPLPGCSITGVDEICALTTGLVFTTTAGMSNYQWSISGNGVITSGTGGQSVTVSATNAGSFTLFVTLTNAFGCTITCEKTVIVNALPVCDITGPDKVCYGGSILTYTYSTIPDMDTYSWSISGDAIIVGAADEQTVVIQTTATGAFNLSVTIVNPAGCTDSCDVDIMIKAMAMTNPHIMYYRPANNN